ncbi:MAG TPA: ABC transporter permease [Acidimicrobiales bacterium]|nr:ABC transporter permease [Acidimicrobiales bacterium]
MKDYFAFALLGLGAGSVYAAIATGLVVTYKGSGIINFAQGALGVWAAYVYDELRTTGDYVLPVAARVHLGDDVHAAAALALGVASAGLLGLLAHLLVFRPLRQAPALGKVVAGVGLMLTMQALVALRFGTEARLPASIVPSETLELGALSVPRDRIYLTVIALAVAAAMWAWFRFSLSGTATRAAADNERAATILGYSPDRLAATTWVLSSMITGFMITLVAPTTGINPTNYTLFVVPALAAALFGRLTSLGGACAAGLALGAVQSIVTLVSSKPWWPAWAASGLGDAVPFLFVVLALFLLGKRLPQRGEGDALALPEVVLPTVRPALLAAAFVGGVVLLAITDGGYRFGIITSMIAAMAALSSVVITGLVGQISLAQTALAGVAGFTLSKVASDGGVPFPLSMLLAAGAAAVLGVLVGVPAVRIRGAQLAVVTLAGAVAIEQFVFRNPQLIPPSGSPIADASLLGFDLGIRQGSDIVRLRFGLLVLVVLTILGVVVANLIRSATGRTMLAVRSNERAAAALGVNVAAVKLVAFGLASFIAGIAGAFVGYSRGQLSVESFGVLVGLAYLAFAYLGGITSVTGALVAGTFAPLGIGFVISDRHIHVGRYYLLVGGLGLLLTAVANPEGIVGAVRHNVADTRRRIAARRARRAAST